MANRINKYHVAPFYWFKFHKNCLDKEHIAAVGALKNNIFSSILKQVIFPKRIKRFTDLDKAVDWALHISKKTV